MNKYVSPATDGYVTNFPLKDEDEDSGPTSREGGRGHRIEEMCGIVDYTNDMATRMKERQMKIEKTSDGPGTGRLVKQLARQVGICTYSIASLYSPLWFIIALRSIIALSLSNPS